MNELAVGLPSVLAEGARSECAPSMRALKLKGLGVFPKFSL